MEFNELLAIKKPVLVIAEIGQNHQGDIMMAKKLIDTAKICGADCVKFQKTNLEEKFTKSALNRPYESSNSWGNTYGEHKAFLEFSNDEFIELQKHANSLNMLFSASAMDPVSLDFLASIHVPFIKIGSGDANNFPLIEQAASKHIPLIISTGMQTFDTVKTIYHIVSKYHKKFALLHCVSSYPTPISDVNLKVIQLYREEFPDIAIGYSGHEPGWVISVGAVALGASIIERHLTLDKSFKGSDHKCSLDPAEFGIMTQNISMLTLALGKPCKTIQNSEITCYRKLGKSLVSSKKILKGRLINEDDLKIKVSEPQGIDAAQIKNVIGTKLTRDLENDEPLLEDCLEG